MIYKVNNKPKPKPVPAPTPIPTQKTRSGGKKYV